MPTSSFIAPLSRSPLSVLRGRPLSPEIARHNPHIITPMSYNSIGADLVSLGAIGAWASGSIPTANLAIAVPFQIAAPFLIRKVLWLNGTTASTDSADVGVYTEDGRLVISGGGTAIAGANTIQGVDVTDTLIPPGRYWLAYVQNGTTATPNQAIPAVGLVRSMGCAQMASAYPLPSTFVPAACANPIIPMMVAASRTLV